MTDELTGKRIAWPSRHTDITNARGQWCDAVDAALVEAFATA